MTWSYVGEKIVIQIILNIVPWLYTFSLKTKELERNLELYAFTIDSDIDIDGAILKFFLYIVGLSKYIVFGGSQLSLQKKSNTNMEWGKVRKNTELLDWG